MNKQQLREEFEQLNEMYRDLPDGAWMAVMEEHGFNGVLIAELYEDGESDTFEIEYIEEEP